MKIFIASEHFFSTSSLSDHLANVSKIFFSVGTLTEVYERDEE